jgi:4-amino-4-deoxy-L-arabinose transferase-like glycosyltransferase
MPAIIKKAATSLILIVVVALAIRVGFLLDYKSHNSDRAVSVIPFLFESGNIAHSVSAGKGFSSPFRVDTGPTAWMTPVYPLILAAIFKLFGVYTVKAWYASVAFNILCVVLACIPIYFAGRRIGGEQHGVALGAVAAWIWGVFPNAILMPVESMWEASLAALLGATLLWATLALDENRSALAWSAYGLLWGATLMTNATLGALLPFMLTWLWWRARKQNRNVIPRAALTLIIAALCCVPWTIRNYRAFHAFVPLRSVLGLQLWLGNNEQTEDIFRGNLHPIYNETERRHYIDVGEITYMREKQSLAVNYMLTHPARELHLSWLRFIAIWAGGALHPIDDFIGTPDPWFRFVLTCNILVALGTLAGAVILFIRRNAYAVPCAAFPAIFPWAYYLTLALPRYRLPIDPILMLLTAVAILAGIEKLRSRVSAAPAEQQPPPRKLTRKAKRRARRDHPIAAQTQPFNPASV